MTRISAEEYRARYGATTGDRVRLGDTDLWIRVADDRTARGDEPVWGYAKNLRSRIAQWDEATGPSELDVVLTGALVVDPVIGVVKADIGIKDGRIAGIGRAGSPAISDGIDLVIGPHTKSFMAYGLIVTPGAIDTHVHTISPELLPPALSAGVTTLITAGFEEPPFAMERTLAALEGWPINVGMQAGARAIEDGHLDALVDAGALGFKIHEDNGAYPELIDHVLGYVEARDLTLSLHTDGLQESAELEDTIAAIAGRTVHAYHVEGTGGGHVPDLLGLVREASILCSSTTPDAAVRGAHGGRARPDDRAQPRALVVRAGRRRARPRAGPGGADGRGRAAARAGRDRDRELGFAGDGPDRGDGAPHVPARARDEGVAPVRRGRRDPGAARRTRASTTPMTATTRRASCATSPR